MNSKNNSRPTIRRPLPEADWRVPARIIVISLAIAALGMAVSKELLPSHRRRAEAYSTVDVSGSNGLRLDPEFALQEYGMDEVLPAGTPLTMWAFSNYPEARKVYSAVPDSAMSLWEVEKSLARLVTSKDKGTYPQTALKAMADAADASTADRIVCLLLWDGEIGGDIRDFVKQARRLANNRKVVAVVCIGLISDNGLRSQAEKTLQCLGNRLIVCGQHDRSQITRLADLLNHQQ